jgi:S-adenosylmethionine hydrolase
MKMSGVITITTDFGHQGPFVGVMKGVMLSRLPEARIVDLTHEILVHWPAEAGFWLARSFSYFPAGTVHVAVVDPGVGTSRDIVAVTAGGHVFLAPDNGLLAPVVGRYPAASIVKLTASRLTHFGIHKPSATFLGVTSSRPSPRSSRPAAACPPTWGTACRAWCPPGWTSPPSRTAS